MAVTANVVVTAEVVVKVKAVVKVKVVVKFTASVKVPAVLVKDKTEVTVTCGAMVTVNGKVKVKQR